MKAASSWSMLIKREKELMLFGLEPNQKSYKGLFLFLFIYVGASLFAAIFTAPTYWLVQWIDSVNSTETTRWLIGKNIDIYYDRLRWAPIVIGLPWMIKKCKLFSLTNIGMPISKKSLATFVACFFGGAAIAISIYLLQYFFCNVSLNKNFESSALFSIIMGALSGALILGFLEEVVFRCLVMRSVYSAFETLSAIILTSLFFSYKHFKVPNSIWNSLPGGPHNSNWDIGFYVAYYDTVGIAYHFDIVMFAGYAMFGAVLAMIYIKRKILWAPIALHAGIVFSMLIYGKVFTLTSSPNDRFFGGVGMINGWLALIILTSIFTALFFLPSSKKSISNNG